MPYIFDYTKKAKDDIQDLNPEIRNRLGKKILFFESLEEIKSHCKKLENPEDGEYRLRIGDYRLIIHITEGNKIIVHKVEYRKDVYK